jgi:hypothetical protein
MLNISQLEQRWLRYKIKQFSPFIATLIVALLSVPIFFFFNTDHVEPKETQLTKNVKKVAPVLPAPLESPMTLEPSMQFIETIGRDEEVPLTAQLTPEISQTASLRAVKPKKEPITTSSQTLIKPSPNTNSAAYSQQAAVIQPTKIPSPDNKPNTMVRGNAAFSIHEIEERFASNANPQLGLFIARYHYDHGNYNEAYNYALKTNSLNNNIEESWLLFAKSLVKLGKIDQARKTLTLYTSKNNSEEAKNLLDSLNQEGQK